MNGSADIIADVRSAKVLRLLRLGHHFKRLEFCDISLSYLLFTIVGLWSFFKVSYFVGQIWCTSSVRIGIGKDNEMKTKYELERIEEKVIVVCSKIS